MTVITQNRNAVEDKIATLINFSIRSNVAVLGINRLESSGYGNVGIVLVSSDTSLNTVKRIRSVAGDEKVVLLDGEIKMKNITGREGVKVLGLKVSELQKEIERLIKTYEVNSR